MSDRNIKTRKSGTDDNLKTEQSKEVQSPRASLAEVFRYATWTDYLYMVVGALSAFITGASIPFFNILFGEIIDRLNSSGSDFKKSVNQVALIFAIMACINLCSGTLQVYCWCSVGERTTQKLREEYVKSILRQEIGWFDMCSPSELSTKVADLSGKIQDGLGRKFSDMMQYIVQFIVSFVVAFYLSWKLTLVLLVAFPVIGGAGAFMINAVTDATTNALVQYSAAGGLATETINAIRTISALNMHSYVISKYRYFLVNSMNIGIFKGFKIGVGNGGLFSAAFATYALGFWYGSLLVADDVRNDCSGSHCNTGGSILATFFSVLMGSIALGQVAPPATAFFASLSSAKEMLILCDRKPLIDGLSLDGNIPQQNLSGKIEFKDITFRYPSRPDVEVCKNFKLLVNPGEIVAICGSSGSGKSTIASLLMRFYNVSEGGLYFDDVNIQEYNTRWVRNQIGYVGQEPVLFSGSIADNIADGLDQDILKTIHNDNTQFSITPEVLREKVIAAATLSNAHEFISRLPNGYDTNVGSNGISLSGGQKQRIAIARALIKNPSILLLDEATSALDANSEKLVQESIDALQHLRNQTIIVIAHRLSTIRYADKICVMKGGVIAELGSHHDLIAQNGLYAHLVKVQLETAMDDLDHGADSNKDDFDAMQGELAVAVKDESSVVLGDGRMEIVNNTDIALVARNRAASAGTSGSRTRRNTNTSDNAGETKPKYHSVDVKGEEVAGEGEAAVGLEGVSGKLWKMVLAHWNWLLVGCIGAAVYGAMFPIWGFILARAQNLFYLTNPDDIEASGGRVAIYFCCLSIGCLTSSTCQFWGLGHVGERISAKVRSDLFESLMHQDISFYDKDENASGILTTRLAEDSRIMHKATGESVAKQLQAMFTLVIGLVIGFTASWKIAFVVLATFPLNIIAGGIQMQAVSGQQHDQNKGSGSHDAILSSALNHMRTISSLSLQFKVSHIYNNATGIIAKEREQRSLVAGLGFGGSQLSMFCTYALLFWYGAQLIDKGEIDFLQLMTAIMSLMLGTFGLGVALADLGDQKEGLQAAKRVFDAIDASINGNHPRDGLSIDGIVPNTSLSSNVSNTKIEFRKVTFSYPNRKDAKIFKNFSIIVEPGTSLALVGPSGGGKSTFMALLLRFYDPDEGVILLNDIDITKYNIRWLRNQMGYVGQEPVLFSGSIEENVTLGRNLMQFDDKDHLKSIHTFDEFIATQSVGLFGSTTVKNTFSLKDSYANGSGSTSYKALVSGNEDKDIEMGIKNESYGEVANDVLEACKLSHADDFVQHFPDKYQTEVGEGSIMISGGQKQRIAIARALIKNPSILLLDEATSALDANSEKLVQESIDDLNARQAYTTVVIAHRLITIKNSTKIAVVESGQVKEYGNHEELLSLNGMYLTLWKKQQSGNQRSDKSFQSLDSNRQESLHTLEN